MAIRIGGTDVIDDNRKGIFQSANVGTFANPARPGSAAVGDLIWSTTDNQLQVWNGSAWAAAVGAGQAISASGGTELTIDGWKVHIFTTSNTFTLSSASADLEYFIVAGGGAGGQRSPNSGGGGGAGGLRKGRQTFNSGSFTITVGGGGAASPGSPAPGGDSSIAHPGGTITATGGGAGGPRGPGGPVNGSPGGSGGGGGAVPTLGSGGTTPDPAQGFPGSSATSVYTGSVFPGHGGGWGGTVVQQFNPDQMNGQNLETVAHKGYLLQWNLPTSYGFAHGAGLAQANPVGPNIFSRRGDPSWSQFAYGANGALWGGPAAAAIQPKAAWGSGTGNGGFGGLPGTPFPDMSGSGGIVIIRYMPIQ